MTLCSPRNSFNTIDINSRKKIIIFFATVVKTTGTSAQTDSNTTWLKSTPIQLIEHIEVELVPT